MKSLSRLAVTTIATTAGLALMTAPTAANAASKRPVAFFTEGGVTSLVGAVRSIEYGGTYTQSGGWYIHWLDATQGSSFCMAERFGGLGDSPTGYVAFAFQQVTVEPKSRDPKVQIVDTPARDQVFTAGPAVAQIAECVTFTAPSAEGTVVITPRLTAA